MLVKEWNQLPDFMRTEEVKPYYDILRKKKFQLMLKRLFDIFVSLIMIVILSPVLLVVSVWIKVDSDGPVFYRQERVTQYGRIFRIFKFRTMVGNADKIGNLVTSKNDTRITNIGNKIRKYRIDEIPQLLNVILGDMSFVGTRPEVMKYVNQYTNEMYATLLLPAGITSSASVEFMGEDEILKQQLDINSAYVKFVLPQKMKINFSDIIQFNFFNDLKICVKTIIGVSK